MTELTNADVAHLKAGDAVVLRFTGGVTVECDALDDVGHGQLVAGRLVTVRFSDGEPSPFLVEVVSPKPPARPEKVDPAVEAFARALLDARNDVDAPPPYVWGRMLAYERDAYRSYARHLLDAGWGRAERVVEVRDCFDDFTDDEIDELAEAPMNVTLSKAVSLLTRRATTVREVREDRRWQEGGAS